MDNDTLDDIQAEEPGKKKKKPKKPKEPKKEKPEKKKKARKNENEEEKQEEIGAGNVKKEIVPLKKALTIIFGTIALTFISVAIGIFLGITFLKARESAAAEEEAVLAATVKSSSLASTAVTSRFSDIVQRNADLTELIGISERERASAELLSILETESAPAESSDISVKGEPVTESNGQHLSETAGKSQSALQNTVSPLRQADSSAKETVGEGAPVRGEAEFSLPAQPIPRSPVTEANRSIFDGYASEFERIRGLTREYVNNSDLEALRSLYASAAGSEGELFELAAESGTNGASEGFTSGMYELSSAYGILADGINYAVRILENGELFDMELVEMTYESAEGKVASAYTIISGY